MFCFVETQTNSVAYLINAVLRQGKPEEEVYSGEYYAGGRRKAGTLTAPGGDQYIGKYKGNVHVLIQTPKQNVVI